MEALRPYCHLMNNGAGEYTLRFSVNIKKKLGTSGPYEYYKIEALQLQDNVPLGVRDDHAQFTELGSTKYVPAPINCRYCIVSITKLDEDPGDDECYIQYGKFPKEDKLGAHDLIEVILCDITDVNNKQYVGRGVVVYDHADDDSAGGGS